MQAAAAKAKGTGGKGRGKKPQELNRKLSKVHEDEEGLSTPPATAKETPGSDPLQKKPRGRRGGKGKASKSGKGEESADKGEHKNDSVLD